MASSKPTFGNDSRKPDDFDISQPWDADNQAWWDWYVGLADNSVSTGPMDALGEDGAWRLPETADIPSLDHDALIDELATPYELSTAAINSFRQDSYVKLPDVLSPQAVMTLRREIVAILERDFDAKLDAGLDKNRHAPAKPGRRFYSAEMVWLENPVIRLFVLSPRIAKICADLLGVDAVRLYHDNLLSKEPGCGRTPWHYDDHHFPLATNDVVTAWIAAQPIPRAMGPLAFAKGMETWRKVADVPFSKADASYDQQVASIFEQTGVEIDDGPFALGEVSFHHNLNFHTAGVNHTPISRCVLANTFFVDGARIVDEPTMVSGDWQKFMPGLGAGDIAASALNPICWPAPSTWAEAPTVGQNGHPESDAAKIGQQS